MENGRQIPDTLLLQQAMELDIPTNLRLHSLIYENEMMTVGDLRKASDKWLQRLPNIGKKTVARLREYFGKHEDVGAMSPVAASNIISELRNKVAQLEARIECLERNNSNVFGFSYA